MDKWITIIPIILSIFAGVYAIFKKIDSEYQEYLRVYYKEVLEPFYYNCVLKKGDVYDFFKYNQLISKYYQVIPTYVLKLVKDNTDESKEKLYRMLCVDFIDNRPSHTNSMLNSLNIIQRVADYFVLLGSIVGMTLVIFSTTCVVLRFIINIYEFIIGVKSIYRVLGETIILVSIIMVIYVGIKFVVAKIRDHTYSLNKNNTNKLIHEKLKQYKNLGEDLFS